MINWIKHTWQTYKVTGQIPYIISIWLPFHVLLVAGVAMALQSWSWVYPIYFVIGWALFGGLGTAVMLHRYVSHRAIKVREWMKPGLYWIGCLAAQGSPIWWAALHRGYHHAHSDKEKDIHSPLKGFWHAYMGWMFGIKHDSVNLKYGVELLRDKQLIWFHKNYNKVVWGTIVILMLIDPMFCLWFYVIPAMVGLHTDSLVNSVCHTDGAGYRPFETKDRSQNVWYLGYFGWGQGWHNNHHSDPRSYDFGTTVSKKWWEFDPCMLWVPIISPWDETKRLWKNWRISCAG
jgi:stearoyl-CoA desaturase (delta-9 desaturase)